MDNGAPAAGDESRRYRAWHAARDSVLGTGEAGQICLLPCCGACCREDEAREKRG